MAAADHQTLDDGSEGGLHDCRTSNWNLIFEARVVWSSHLKCEVGSTLSSLRMTRSASGHCVELNFFNADTGY